MPDAVSASERKLREAMDRLLAGAPLRTDGRLIKENLYREAEVSRATMNRASAVLEEWNRRVDGTQPRDKEIEKLKRQLTEYRSHARVLRSRVRELEAQLIIAATSVAELHVENQLLRSDDAERGIALIRPRSNGRRE